MRVVTLAGTRGAAQAKGLVVIIDVLRAFTVSAYALAGGAREVIYVPDLADATRLSVETPGAVLCAEEDGLPVPGVAISNSPTMIAATDLRDRVLIQRSSAGVPALAAATAADSLLAASLVVVAATARHITETNPDLVSLVASRADHPEDRACASYLEALLRGEQPDLDGLLEPLRASGRYARQIRNEFPGFPHTDLDLSLTTDRFNFALPVDRGEHGHLRVLAPRSGRRSGQPVDPGRS